VGFEILAISAVPLLNRQVIQNFKLQSLIIHQYAKYTHEDRLSKEKLRVHLAINRLKEDEDDINDAVISDSKLANSNKSN
jgi:hypothetical protein